MNENKAKRKVKNTTKHLSALDCVEEMAKAAKKADMSMTKAIKAYRKGKLDGTILESEFSSVLFLLEGQKDHLR